ncbi:SRPBCC family protein [Aminobacter sp. MET-1]|nr:SRPBCC family protein [Aminobacter sp. MET-1]
MGGAVNTFDRIEKEIVLRAPIERVWQAITNIDEFAQWFGIKLNQNFAPGKTITGTFEGGFDEAYVMRCQVSFGLEPTAIRLPQPNTVFCTVERMEAPSLFSFRWIPYGIDAAYDPAKESTTLVEFRLKPVAEGTRLTVTETGFEGVPPHRRKRAFMMNEGGWSAQIGNLRRYVERI